MLEEELTNELRNTAKQLEEWAEQSLTGGWSTHQVKPMRQKANDIYSVLGRINKNKIFDEGELTG